jgi:hypothetical protein
MNKHALKSALLAAALSIAFAAAAQSNVLTAAKVDAAPVLDGTANDAAWAKATPVTIKLANGANFDGGKTTVTIKAVYTADSLYMLIVYDDPTESFRRSPFQKQADGTWKKLSDPNDKGGDNNVYYEDKWAMIWNIGNSIKNFEKAGCMATCHVGEPGKPYGNKYTAEAGELGDIWHAKSVRGAISLGQPDNQYVDHTRFDKEKAPEAGRKSDPKTGGGYTDIKLVNGKPEFMAKDAKPANKGGTYWLKEEDKAPFDDAKFVAGDEVSSILVSKFTGERGNLSGGGKWADGKWTYEVARKLVTGSPYDVQFKDLDGGYAFGFAAFDNAQVRHAWHYGPVVLKFAK